jgi:hypothetical protein
MMKPVAMLAVMRAAMRVHEGALDYNAFNYWC